MTDTQAAPVQPTTIQIAEACEALATGQTIHGEWPPAMADGARQVLADAAAALRTAQRQADVADGTPIHSDLSTRLRDHAEAVDDCSAAALLTVCAGTSALLNEAAVRLDSHARLIYRQADRIAALEADVARLTEALGAAHNAEGVTGDE